MEMNGKITPKTFFNGNMLSLYQHKLKEVLTGNKYNTQTYLLGKKNIYP